MRLEALLRLVRSPKWRALRRIHLKVEPACAWCGGVKSLEVHHVVPVHIDPSRELDPQNLITLCEAGGFDCHLRHGHNGNWSVWNPSVRQQADVRRRHGYRWVWEP